MKLIINIPEKTYNALTHTEFDAKLVVNEMRKSIVNGVPMPDNATNGYVIRKLFSNDELTKYLKDQWTYWWNAPYQKGE